MDQSEDELETHKGNWIHEYKQIPHLSLTTSNLSIVDAWKEKMVPFTMELRVHLAKDCKDEGAYPAGAGGIVGSSAVAHHLSEPADPQQYIWAVTMPAALPDAPVEYLGKKKKLLLHFCLKSCTKYRLLTMLTLSLAEKEMLGEAMVLA